MLQVILNDGYFIQYKYEFPIGIHITLQYPKRYKMSLLIIAFDEFTAYSIWSIYVAIGIEALLPLMSSQGNQWWAHELLQLFVQTPKTW